MWQDSFEMLEKYIDDVDYRCNEYVISCRDSQLAAIENFIRLNVDKGDVLYSDCKQGYIIAYTFLGLDNDGVVHLIEDLGGDIPKQEKTMSVEELYKLLRENQDANG